MHPHTIDEPLPGLSPGRTRAILAVVALSLMAVISAVSGLNVALPAMARETGATQTQLTWIVDAYTVVSQACCSSPVRSAIATDAACCSRRASSCSDLRPRSGSSPRTRPT